MCWWDPSKIVKSHDVSKINSNITAQHTWKREEENSLQQEWLILKCHSRRKQIFTLRNNKKHVAFRLLSAYLYPSRLPTSFHTYILTSKKVHDVAEQYLCTPHITSRSCLPHLGRTGSAGYFTFSAGCLCTTRRHYKYLRTISGIDHISFDNQPLLSPFWRYEGEWTWGGRGWWDDPPVHANLTLPDPIFSIKLMPEHQWIVSCQRSPIDLLRVIGIGHIPNPNCLGLVHV